MGEALHPLPSVLEGGEFVPVVLLKEAKSLSENDRKAAVLEWFEDYDMY